MSRATRPYKQDRRYYLHRKLKGRYTYSATTRTVLVPPDYPDNNSTITELRDTFLYNIQYSISTAMNFTTDEKEEITNTLGKHYSGKVIAHLNSKGITNADGNPYSADSVRNIVNGTNGRSVNPEVVAAILELVADTKKSLAGLEKKRKKVLKAS